MKITAAHIGIDGTKLQGEESCDILDMASDPEFRAKGVIKYDIFAQLAGSDLVTRVFLKRNSKPAARNAGGILLLRHGLTRSRTFTRFAINLM